MVFHLLTWVGSGLTGKNEARLERPIMGKHFSSLRIFVNYSHEKFYNFGSWMGNYKSTYELLTTSLTSGVLYRKGDCSVFARVFEARNPM